MSSQMRREIAEQPEAVRRTWAALSPRRAEVRRRCAGRRQVLFAARGTSDNAATYGRYLLETHAGVRAAMLAPSVATHYGARLTLVDCVVVSVSQSGETEDIVATQDWARSRGALTIAVTNVADSPLAEGADLALRTCAGPESAIPATKTYLTQLVAMAALGTALGEHPGELDRQLDRVPNAIEQLLADPGEIEQAVELLGEASETIVTSRGLLLGTAMETALKLEETCLRPVRSYSYADLRHGPISVVGPGVLSVLVAAPGGPMAAAMADLAADLRQRGSRILGIGGDAGFRAHCDVALAGPELPETVAPLAAIVPAQLTVEAQARRLGLDPDAPRGLAKLTRTEGTSSELSSTGGVPA